MIPVRVKVWLWFAIFRVRLSGYPIRPHIQYQVPALDVEPKNDSTSDRSKSPLEERVFAVIPLAPLFTFSLWWCSFYHSLCEHQNSAKTEVQAFRASDPPKTHKKAGTRLGGHFCPKLLNNRDQSTWIWWAKNLKSRRCVSYCRFLEPQLPTLPSHNTFFFKSKSRFSHSTTAPWLHFQDRSDFCTDTALQKVLLSADQKRSHREQKQWAEDNEIWPYLTSGSLTTSIVVVVLNPRLWS